MTWDEEDSHHLTQHGRALKDEIIREWEEREAFLLATSRRYRIRRRFEDLMRRIRYRIAGL